MPTAQARPRSVSPCRNGVLSPYPASVSTHPKRTLAAIARSTSAKAISGLHRAVRCSIGTRARFKRDTLLVQLSGRKRRNATITGTSPRARVSDTSVWQFAADRSCRMQVVLPSAERFCDRQGRSIPQRTRGTSAAGSYDPVGPGTASASVRVRLPHSAMVSPPRADHP